MAPADGAAWLLLLSLFAAFGEKTVRLHLAKELSCALGVVIGGCEHVLQRHAPSALPGQQANWLKCTAPSRTFLLDLLESILLQRAQAFHKLPPLAVALRQRVSRRLTVRGWGQPTLGMPAGGVAQLACRCHHTANASTLPLSNGHCPMLRAQPTWGMPQAMNCNLCRVMQEWPGAHAP